MPARGRAWERMTARIRAESIATNAPCWLCNGAKGPILYDAEYNDPLSFTVDHVQPTSLGGDSTRRDLLKPAHRSCNSSRGNTTRGQFPTSRQW